MPPINPNDPNQSPNPGPGQNQPLKPQVEKLKFEDIADVDQIQSEMNRIFKVSAVVEKEEKKSAEIHMKYLKLIETAERHKHTMLMKEKKEMLKALEDEMRIQKNLAMGNVPSGPKRVAEGKRVEAEFRDKIEKLHGSFAPKIAAQSLRAAGSEGSGVLAGVTTKLADFIEILPKLGSAMTIASGVVTALVAVFKLGTERLADLTKLQSQLRAGGIGFTESAKGIDTALDASHRLGQNMAELGESTQDVNRMVTEFSKAPDVLHELMDAGGPKAWKTIRDAVGGFGIDAQSAAEMVVSASKSQNLSMTDLSKMFVNASHVAISSRMNFKDAFNSLLNINASMRNLTFNTDEARKVFTATTFVLRNMTDMKLSPEETQKFAAGIASAIGGMTVDKLTGVLAFVKGRMPTEDEMAKGLGLDTIVDFITKAMGNDFKGPQSLNKIAGLMQELGVSVGNSPVQGAKAMKEVLLAFQKDHGATLQKVLDDNLSDQMTGSEKQAQKAAEAMKKAQQDGFEAMKQMVPPLSKLETALGDFANSFVEGFMPTFSSFATNFDKFVKYTTFQSARDAASTVGSDIAHPMRTLHRWGSGRSDIETSMNKAAAMRQYRKMQAYKQDQIGTRY